MNKSKVIYLILLFSFKEHYFVIWVLSQYELKKILNYFQGGINITHLF